MRTTLSELPMPAPRLAPAQSRTVRAGWWPRFGAFLIDSTLVITVAAALEISLHTAGAAAGPGGPAPVAAPLPDLPTYPFQHQSYWLHPVHPRHAANGNGGDNGNPHPFLTSLFSPPETGTLQFSGHVSIADHPWLASHAPAVRWHGFLAHGYSIEPDAPNGWPR